VAIVAASGLVLAFAILLGFRALDNGKSAATPVSTPTRPAATSTPTVTAPPHHAPASPVKAPSQELATGDSGSQVELLQRALAALGFSAGTPDGNYGPATQAAVERFQAAEGLPQVGVVGPQTLAALHHALSRRSGR
jgi:peptidoglycan hydrolase-like protein with peptidoglycan-binding domain